MLAKTFLELVKNCEMALAKEILPPEDVRIGDPATYSRMEIVRLDGMKSNGTKEHAPRNLYLSPRLSQML